VAHEYTVDDPSVHAAIKIVLHKNDSNPKFLSQRARMDKRKPRAPDIHNRELDQRFDNVQSALLNIERGFSDGFAQSRMRVGGAADIFGAAAEFDH